MLTLVIELLWSSTVQSSDLICEGYRRMASEGGGKLEEFWGQSSICLYIRLLYLPLLIRVESHLYRMLSRGQLLLRLWRKTSERRASFFLIFLYVLFFVENHIIKSLTIIMFLSFCYCSLFTKYTFYL